MKIIRDDYNIDPEIDIALEVFLELRNKLVHGICVERRYDLWDEWGQKELLAFVFLFTYMARSIRMTFRSCYIVSTLYERDKLKIKQKISDEEIDAIDLFRSCFKFKE